MPDSALLVLAASALESKTCRWSGLLLETIFLQKHDLLSLTADTFTLHLWMETLHDQEVLLVIHSLSKKETL
jgi:hypothetical protein